MKVRSLLAGAALAVGSLIALAPAASADVCADVHVNLNGSDVVNESVCVPV